MGEDDGMYTWRTPSESFGGRKQSLKESGRGARGRNSKTISDGLCSIEGTFWKSRPSEDV